MLDMLDFFNIEKQVAKRVGKFIAFKAAEAGIAEENARLLLNLLLGRVSVHLYEQNHFVATLDLQAMAEYFGKSFDTEKEEAIRRYLEALAGREQIPVPELYIIIGKSKKELGAYIYQQARFVRRLPLMEIAEHFYNPL